MATTRTKSKRQTRPDTRSKDQCRGCPATCCHTLALIVNRPRDRDDVEFYKWQLQYDVVSIAIVGHRWHTVYKGRCMYLDGRNMCAIYDRRPEKCRRHNPPECERYGEWYDVMLDTPEELDEYIRKEKERKKRRRKRAARKRTKT